MLCVGLVFAGASARAQPLPPGVIYPGEYKNYLAAINTQDLVARAQAIKRASSPTQASKASSRPSGPRAMIGSPP